MWKYLLSKYPDCLSVSEWFFSHPFYSFLWCANAQVINGQSLCVFMNNFIFFSVDIWNYSIYVDQMCLMDY